MDKARNYSGKTYLNGTVVNHVVARCTRTEFGQADATDKRNRVKRQYRIKSKQRNKIYDAITYQNWDASRSNDLHHCFITLTFARDRIPENPNQCVSTFFDKMVKRGCKNYVWVREIGTKGHLVHYHATYVAPRLPINTKKGWSINRCWCESRGYYSGNAVRTERRSGLVVKDVVRARQYVAKYMSKAEANQDHVKGRIYAVSNDLIFEPAVTREAVYIAAHLCNADFFQTDWATVGYVQPQLAVNWYRKMKFEELRNKEEENYEVQRLPSHSRYKQLTL